MDKTDTNALICKTIGQDGNVIVHGISIGWL